MSILPPSQFLPSLPRSTSGQPSTLSPLLSTRLEECIAKLRILLLPGLAGIDGAVVTEGTSGGETDSLDEESRTHVGEAVMDEFERSWAENWLNQVIRRGEAWLAELEEDGVDDTTEETPADFLKTVENVRTLDEAEVYVESENSEESSLRTDRSVDTASSGNKPSFANSSANTTELDQRHSVLHQSASLLSLLSGCTASGAILRELRFPLAKGLDYIQSLRLAALNIPTIQPRTMTTKQGSASASLESDSDASSPSSLDLVIQVNDAPLADHLSVGVQTWGSSILLGREITSDPVKFGLGLDGMGVDTDRPRILELGAGTGVLSILIRGLLDLSSGYHDESLSTKSRRKGTVVATDYHPLVLENLRACLRLNFGRSTTERDDDEDEAIEVHRLDWSTFPEEAEKVLGMDEGQEVELELMEKLGRLGRLKQEEGGGGKIGTWALPPSPAPSTPLIGSNTKKNTSLEKRTLSPPFHEPFDTIFASDCVYDLTHATLLRQTASWLLRLPDGKGDKGGILHLLSPVRRTYNAETESIGRAFPMLEEIPARKTIRRRVTKMAEEGSGSSTPLSSQSGFVTPSAPISTAHSASAVNLPQLRSGMATPLELNEEERELFSQGMGLGKKDGWRLCTVERRELERISGSGRSDELIYMWWTIMWG